MPSAIKYTPNNPKTRNIGENTTHHGQKIMPVSLRVKNKRVRKIGSIIFYPNNLSISHAIPMASNTTNAAIKTPSAPQKRYRKAISAPVFGLLDV
jgi:hypothetical protein